MAVRLINPEFSFIKFGSYETQDACCKGNGVPVLPIASETDLSFQVTLETDTVWESVRIESLLPTQCQFYIARGTNNDGLPLFTNLIRNWVIEDNLYFDVYRTGKKHVTFCWNKPLKDITELLACNECFQFGVHFSAIDIGGPLQSVGGLSNPFMLTCDDCFESVLEYSNANDYAGFYYCHTNGFKNRIRLPLYFSYPKPVEEVGIYKKSNGQVIQHYNILNREYIARTERFTHFLHEKLQIALAHEVKTLESPRYTGEFYKNGEYTVEWDEDEDLCDATATFKALTTRELRNNSCQDCSEINIACPLVSITNYSAVANGDGTKTFTFNFATIPGATDLNIRYRGVGVPTWTDSYGPATSPRIITLPTGNYDFEFLPISEECIAINPTRIENIGGCVEPEINPVPNPPAATLGVPYLFQFTIVGDPPFTLYPVTTKPAWMNITVDGNIVTFSGTPDTLTDESNNVSTGFINECGGAPFVTTVSVIE